MRILRDITLGDAGTETIASAKDVTSEVINGDAFDLIGKCASESIDLLITSPPYWGLRTYDLEHNWQIAEDWKQTSTDPAMPPSYDWYRAHGGVLGLEPSP